MKHLFLLTCLGVLALPPVLSAQQPAFPPYSLFNTQIRFVHSQHVGRVFKLFINLPRHYQDEPERQYPALYLLDPGAHFGMTTDMQRLFEDGQGIEPVLTVGIGYESIVIDTLIKYRTTDMLPSPDRDGHGGGAPQFLAFIEDELIPFIEAEYRVNPKIRGICGASYGGMFGAYALVKAPELFNRYILISPTLGFGEGAFFAYEAEMAQGRTDLPARIYFAAGADEDRGWMLDPLAKFVQQLRDRKYPSAAIELDIVAGENHSTVGPIGIDRGLNRMFALRGQ
ncbi:MAG: alpha/beta hydrolase [Candidatus Latescibacteria bacterium]|nr:alpha/beta hydrolase [Candidatus Latescibacterota bacterium]